MEEIPTLPVVLCGKKQSGKEALFYRFVHKSFSTADARPRASGTLTGLRSLRLSGRPTVFISVYCTKGFFGDVTAEPTDLRALWGDPAACRAVVLVVDGEAAFINDNVEEVMGELPVSARAHEKTNRGCVVILRSGRSCRKAPLAPRRDRICRAQNMSSFSISSGTGRRIECTGPWHYSKYSRVVSDNQLGYNHSTL